MGPGGAYYPPLSPPRRGVGIPFIPQMKISAANQGCTADAERLQGGCWRGAARRGATCFKVSHPHYARERTPSESSGALQPPPLPLTHPFHLPPPLSPRQSLCFYNLRPVGTTAAKVILYERFGCRVFPDDFMAASMAGLCSWSLRWR